MENEVPEKIASNQHGLLSLDVQSRYILFLLVVTIAVGGLAFQAGRQSARTAMDRESNKQIRESISMSSASGEPEEPIDLSKVTIANIGSVSFEEAYHLLRSAPPETVRRWVQQLQAMPIGPKRTTALDSFFRIMAQVDAARAVDLVLSLTNRESFAIAFAAVRNAAPESALSQIVRLVIKSDADKWTWTDVVAELSLFGPEYAQRFADEHRDKVETEGLAALAGNWAAVDPAAARAWVDSLDRSRRKSRVIEDFILGWSEKDRPSALDYLVEHSKEKVCKRATTDTAVALFRESSDGAGAFILRLADQTTQGVALDEIALSSSARPESNKDYTAEAVTRWMLSLPGEIWQKHIGSAVSLWSRNNPGAVPAWLNQLPTQVRDQIAAEFCATPNWDSPQEAIEAGLKITDHALQAQVFDELRKFVGDRERAQDFMQHLHLQKRDQAKIESVLSDL